MCKRLGRRRLRARIRAQLAEVRELAERDPRWPRMPSLRCALGMAEWMEGDLRTGRGCLVRWIEDLDKYREVLDV